ncbi:putative transcription factor C2H2 family [Dioscorea sansibarensis]
MNITNTSLDLTPSSSSTPSSMFDSNGQIGGYGYGIGISVGILLLITTITLASYFCTRSSTTTARRRPASPTDSSPMADIESGIDEATLRSYPKVTYSEAKIQGKSTTETCCSICLADYKDTDVLRLLPECRHLFHLKCVDPWLRHHPTCPVCRTSPAPSPLPTPLAEVAPLREV